MPLLQIEPFSHDMHSGPFDSGIEALDQYFERIAGWAESAGDARVYVAVHVDGVVAAYYTLSSTSLAYEQAPEPLRKGAAKRPIPAILLGRLAVDRRHHGRGLGRELLDDAARRTSVAARSAGVRALVVDAKDDRSMQWYLDRAPFIESPALPRRLVLPIKDVYAASISGGIDEVPGEQVRGRFLVDRKDGAEAEGMWFEVGAEGTYMVRNIPVLVSGVAFNDVIRMVQKEARGKVATEVVARGGYANVLMGWSDRAGSDERTEAITRWSLDWGVIHEGVRFPVFGVAVPWQHMEAFRDDIESGQVSGLISDYDITCGVGESLGVFPTIEFREDPGSGLRE